MKEATFTFRIEPDLKRKFEQAAKNCDRPTAQLLREFMRDFVEEQEKRAMHDVWFRSQVDEAVREANDPSTVWVSNEEALAEMDREEAELLSRIKSGA